MRAQLEAEVAMKDKDWQLVVSATVRRFVAVAKLIDEFENLNRAECSLEAGAFRTLPTISLLLMHPPYYYCMHIAFPVKYTPNLLNTTRSAKNVCARGVLQSAGAI